MAGASHRRYARHPHISIGGIAIGELVGGALSGKWNIVHVRPAQHKRYIAGMARKALEPTAQAGIRLPGQRPSPQADAQTIGRRLAPRQTHKLSSQTPDSPSRRPTPKVDTYLIWWMPDTPCRQPAPQTDARPPGRHLTPQADARLLGRRPKVPRATLDSQCRQPTPKRRGPIGLTQMQS